MGNDAVRAMLHGQDPDAREVFARGAQSPVGQVESPLEQEEPLTVHKGPEADAALQALNAKGATLGGEVLLAEGAGPDVLSHEAAHVAQADEQAPRRPGVDQGPQDTAEQRAQTLAEEQVTEEILEEEAVQPEGPTAARTPAAEVQRFSLGEAWESITNVAHDAWDTVSGWFGGNEEDDQQTTPAVSVRQPATTPAGDVAPVTAPAVDVAPPDKTTPAPDKVSPPEQAEVLANGLHFFPGSHLLVYVKDGKVVEQVAAKGGPQAEETTTDGSMPPGPTDTGDFRVAGTEAYNTPSWLYSRIDWGTPLIDKGNDIWYLLPSGQYGSLKKDHGINRDDVVAYHQNLYDKAIVPKTWVFNDFGPLAVRYYRDLNGNGKQDPKEALEGEMIHTTPLDEAKTAKGEDVTLTDSHGCIHIKPADRDTLSKAGAFSAGISFKIHSYSEKLRV